MCGGLFGVEVELLLVSEFVKEMNINIVEFIVKVSIDVKKVVLVKMVIVNVELMFIWVGIDKVDLFINMVGELVII